MEELDNCIHYIKRGDKMININSFIFNPEKSLGELKKDKYIESYFIEITDEKRILKIKDKLDPWYINGSIVISNDDNIILDFKHCDLIDQLWSYLINLLEDTLLNDEGTEVYFPDQPIRIYMKLARDSIIFEIDNHLYILPLMFIFDLIKGAFEFFNCMNKYLPGYYENELYRIRNFVQNSKFISFKNLSDFETNF